MSSIAAALVALALLQSSPGPTAPEPVPAPAAPVPPLPEAEPPVPSLLSAEPLRGASLLSAAAGWPRLRAAYAQGVSHDIDLGVFADLDYSTSELRVGATYRGQVIPRAPPFDGALRLSLAWYHDFGSRWLYRKNHVDQGLEIGVGASYSRRGGRGILSLLADLPVTITFRKDGGLLVNPRGAIAYETWLYGPFTVGLQLGLGVRGGLGNAPLKQGMAEVTALALASYKL